MPPIRNSASECFSCRCICVQFWLNLGGGGRGRRGRSRKKRERKEVQGERRRRNRGGRRRRRRWKEKEEGEEKGEGRGTRSRVKRGGEKERKGDRTRTGRGGRSRGGKRGKEEEKRKQKNQEKEAREAANHQIWQNAACHVALAALLASRALIQHDEGHSPGVQFWKSLANGFPETNGKRGGLGGKCGRGRRPFPLFNKKKPLPLSPWAFFPQGPLFCKCFKQHNRKLHLQVKH